VAFRLAEADGADGREYRRPNEHGPEKPGTEERQD
jgi:hypothetical protein